ncbi:hypothetical protein T12_8680, partial [Trichinella patagoniensis]
LLNFQIEQCISSVHIVSLHRLEFILSKRFQCTKTGFQRCAMQMTIAIKDMNNEEKSESVMDTKQSADGT